MKMQIVIPILVFTILAGAVAGGGTERPVAVLTHLVGTVRVDGKPARLLQSLSIGARIECQGQTSGATLSYVKGGVRVRLFGAQSYTVVASPPVGSDSRVEVTRPAAGTSMALPDQVNIDRMGGGRPADTVLLLVGKTMDPSEPLEWRSTALYAEFAVAIDGPGLKPWHESRPMRGATTRIDDDGTSWVNYHYAIPPDVANAMNAGREYEFRLTASERSGANGHTWRARFRVADTAVTQQLAPLREKVISQLTRAPSDTALAMELAQRYLGQDMLFSALNVVEMVEGSNPHIRELRQRLVGEAVALQEAQNSRGSRGTPTP